VRTLTPAPLGYYHVVPTGLCFGSLRSDKGQMDKVQLSSRPQLSGRTETPSWRQDVWGYDFRLAKPIGPYGLTMLRRVIFTQEA
jgi:hypothetical protein